MRCLRRYRFWVVVALGISVVALVTVTGRSSCRGPDEDSASTESDAAHRLCQSANGVSAAPLPPSADLPPPALLRWHPPAFTVVLHEALPFGALLPRAPPPLFC